MAVLEPAAPSTRDDHSAEEAAALELVRLAREQGLDLTGPGGLLKQVTKAVMEEQLEGELAEHLEKAAEAAPSNRRGRSRTKTVQTPAAGDVQIMVPRDTAGTFVPRSIPRWQRRTGGMTEAVLSLSARGLTHGEISAHFAEVYDVDISKETVQDVTDTVLEEMHEWLVRPLDGVFAAIFIDAIVVKIRDGHVANRPVYAAIGVTLSGEKEILGLWVGSGGEGAKFWLSVLTDLKNRGVRDTFFLVCDGLKGLPDAVEAVWPLATVQTCVIHLLRNSFRLTSKKDWDPLKRSLRLIYGAPTHAAASLGLETLTREWGDRYPALVQLWKSAWNEFEPYLDYDAEIRHVLWSTNAIESLNARYRRAVRSRGHFPTEQAALKCLYLVTRSIDPTGRGRAKWMTRWKPALNAFAITFAERWPGVEAY